MCAAHVLHGVDAVEHEVHEHLLQLDTLGHDPGKIRIELGAHGDGVACRVAPQDANHFSNELVDVDALPRHRTLLEQGADAGDDVGRARDVGDHSPGGFTSLV